MRTKINVLLFWKKFLDSISLSGFSESVSLDNDVMMKFSSHFLGFNQAMDDSSPKKIRNLERSSLLMSFNSFVPIHAAIFPATLDVEDDKNFFHPKTHLKSSWKAIRKILTISPIEEGH